MARGRASRLRSVRRWVGRCTWIALADGGLTFVSADGKASTRPFYRTRRRFDCTGAILGDVLYIGSEDHFVHAIPLTAQRGENRWQGSSLGRTGCAISAPLVIGDDTIVLGVSQTPRNQPARGLLLAIDAQTRRICWQFATDEPIEGTPVIGDNAGVVYAVDRQGQLLWRADVGSPSAPRARSFRPGWSPLAQKTAA